ncbi:disease resistance protein Roq1-like [Cryptomeria japonica]|uniref:disease resistance protein Roq1-like n=1 Tax=Cryptomeria japonica TaxID=3369 RepID=UPI0027DA444A|nr:disease resistance protein Roq1-like [Cryptomeria japonica]
MVVSAVIKEVKKTHLLEVAKSPVGLNELVEDCERKCCLNEKKRGNILGIFEMGGSRKTTLAKELYNCKHLEFKASCFLFDVREASATSQLPSLQTKLLKDLVEENHPKFGSQEEGKNYLKNRFGKRGISLSFLIVVDDIDHADQLDALSVMDMLNIDSLAIVTARDERVLVRAGITARYKMKEMNLIHSRQLFCWHAFGHPNPTPGYENLVESFVKRCGGLPLSLQVIGRLAFGRNDKEHWKLVLNKEKSMAIRIWEGLGWCAEHSLQTLKEKCLVEEETNIYKSTLRMHDHLQDLGRGMAHELNLPPRIWRPQHLRTLESEGYEKILATAKGHSFRCLNSIFEMSIRSQITYFLGNRDDYSNTSVALLWFELDLSWHWHKSIPSWIPLQNLQCLKIKRGHLKRLWPRTLQVTCYKCSRSSSTIHQQEEERYGSRQLFLYETASHYPRLESLHLVSIESLIKLSIIGPPTMHFLAVEDCKKLLSISEEFDLAKLVIFDCPKLQTLPSLANSRFLERITVDKCWRLRKGVNAPATLKYLHYYAAPKLVNSFISTRKTMPSELTSIIGKAVHGAESTLNATLCSHGDVVRIRLPEGESICCSLEEGEWVWNIVVNDPELIKHAQHYIAESYWIPTMDYPRLDSRIKKGYVCTIDTGQEGQLTQLLSMIIGQLYNRG